MLRIPISPELITTLFDGCQLATDYSTGEPIKNDKQWLQYRVGVIARMEGDRASQHITVKLFSPKNLDEAIPLFTPVTFVGLVVTVYEMNGKTGVSFAADSVGTVKAAKE